MILDFTEARKAREPKPDADHVFVDVLDGVPVHFYRFACDFEYEGREWAFDLWATSYEDAEARVKAIGASGNVAGQVFATVPA